MSTALAIIEIKNPVEVFVEKGLDSIIDKIEQEVRAAARGLDISTPQGRKDIASLAYKVAQSKTALDKAGKDLVADQKDTIKKVDAERARGWDRMETLQHEIRKPLTDWEEAEKARVAAHEAALDALVQLGLLPDGYTSAEVQKRIEQFESLPQRDWQEFAVRAEAITKTTLAELHVKLAGRQQYEAEQAELERLRREEEERKQKERDERIAAEAAEKARLEAEEKARKEAEAEAARVKAEQEKAEKERRRIEEEKQQAERQKAEAEERARKADEDRLAAIAKAEEERKAAAEKAERDRIAAAEKAKRDAEAAAQAERDRIERERQAEAEATAKREADKKHRAKIERSAIEDLVSSGLEAEAARIAIEAISRNKIRNIIIKY